MGPTAESVDEQVPDDIAAPLLQHAHDEFTFFSRSLPTLYRVEHDADSELAVRASW